MQYDHSPREPFKLKFIRPAEMLLFSNAICDPPLGQSTTIPDGQKTVSYYLKADQEQLLTMRRSSSFC